MHLNVRGGALCVLAAGFAVAVPAGLVALLDQDPVAQRDQRRVFREARDAVLVDVYPQQDGRIVEGLTRDDFEAFEDDVPQAIEAFDFIRIEPKPPDVIRRDPNNQLAALAAAADPYNRVFVVLLDTLHTTVTGSHAIRRPLLDTLDRLVTRDDLLAVTTQSHRPTDLVFGRVLDSIDDQLRRYWAWGERHWLKDVGGMLTGLDENDPVEAMLDSCYSTKVAGGIPVPWYIDDEGVKRLYSEVIIERRREDRVIGSLENLVAYLGDIRPARTTLLVVTDGWIWFPVDRALAEHMTETEIVASPAPPIFIGPGGRLTTRDPHAVDRNACNQELIRLAELDNPARLRDLMEDARRRSVSVYPVNPAGLATDSPPVDGAVVRELPERFRRRQRARVEGLLTLAEGTDAFAVVNTNDLAGGLRRIAEDVSAYYLLGYFPTNTEVNGEYRTIRVNVKRPGIHVRARRGYRTYATTPAGSLEREPPRDDAADAIADAFGRLSTLRSGMPVYLHGVARDGDVAIVVELGAARALRATGATPVSVQLRDAEGAVVGEAVDEVRSGTRGVLLRVELADPRKGPWRAMVEVGEGRNRLQDSVDVVSAGARLVGAAVLFRATPSPRSPLIPVADYLFRRTERLHVEWPRLAEIDRREARLLGRNGEPLAVPVALTERESDGRASVAADVNLAPLTDGEYAIELVVGQGSETERRVVAIRVTR